MDDFPVFDVRRELAREDLLHLLSCLEGELQGRDVAIAALKSERAKRILYEVKYGHLTIADPFKALQRDSKIGENDSRVEESDVGKMYESQISQLERLISVQRHSHQRSLRTLAGAERRHLRILRELDEEKKRSVADAAHGDDICALLENDRTRLRQQLDYEQRESDKIRKEMEKLEKQLSNEKERHKSIVLFLINERKQLLCNLYELKMRNENNAALCNQHEPKIVELRQDLASMSSERDHYRKAFETAKNELNSLREVLRNQEHDMPLLHNSSQTSARHVEMKSQSLKYHNNHSLMGDGSLVVINKSASASLPCKKSFASVSPSFETHHTDRAHFSSSSTFPTSEKFYTSKVPLPSDSRAPTSPMHTLPPPPNKKRTVATTAHPVSTNFLASRSSGSNMLDRTKSPSVGKDRIKSLSQVEPEIEQLGAVIESMSTKINRRSSSLPRNGKNSDVTTSQQQQKRQSPINISSSKRSGFFRALGVSARTHKNCA